MKKNEVVISQEVALNELESFVNAFSKKPVERNKLSEMYPDVLDGIMEGYVKFDDNNVPTVTLREPILNDAETVSVSTVNFKTRIKPTDKANLGRGLSIQTDLLNYNLRLLAHIIGQPLVMVDKFGDYDYDCINQIATVFS